MERARGAQSGHKSGHIGENADVKEQAEEKGQPGV